MKRLGAVLSLALIIVLLAAGFCFADVDGFKLIKTYPKDGNSSASVDNFSIKLYFNKPVLNEANEANNKNCIIVKDAEGLTIPTDIYYSSKEEGLVMVLYRTSETDEKGKPLVKESTDYTVTVSENFLSADGTALGEKTEIQFSTLNQSANTGIYMVMMVIMFAGMFFFSSKAMKKENEKKKEDEKVNPYKKAKETGKSVEEIVAKDQKQKAKKAAAEAKREKRALDDSQEDDDIAVDNGNKKVKGPRPISAGGSTYITGRKAEAEARALEARQKGTTNPKKKAGKPKKRK